MTEQPTAPRTRRTPDTCSKCGAPGYRIVDDSGDGSVRFERAAASVPAPGQEEAVREALFAAAEHINHSGKGSADYRAGWRDALEAVARDPALATPPPAASVPAPEQEEAVRPGVVRWTFPKDSVIFNGDGSVSVPAPEQEEAVPPWDHPYESRGESMACIHCGWVGSYAHTAEFYQKWVFPALATPPPVPATLWRLQGEYVVDRDGLVWRVVRDGGMATRADYAGIESIGIEALRSTKGPLASLNDFVDAAAGAVPAAPGLQEAVEGIENVLTGMDWIGTGSSQKAADDDERKAWQQWGVILSALGDNRDPHKRVYETGGDPRVAVPAAPGLDVDLMKRIVRNGVPPDALMDNTPAGQNLRNWWLERWAPVLQEVRARLTGHQEDDPRPKLSNEHRSGMDAIGRLDERVPPDENGRVVIREAHLIDPETGDEWPFNADAWKERDRQRRNAVLDEIEQRLDAQTEPDIYDGDDENTRVMIGRVTYKRIIEDMRRGG